MTEADAQDVRPLSDESFTVEASLPAERLDTYLHRRYPQVSRVALQRLIAEGHIRVNGRGVKPAHRPAAGETVCVTWPPPQPTTVQPEAIALDVLYEDDCLLVVNKPPGLVVHPAAGHEEHTLVNALLQHCAGQLSGIGGVLRPGIVHRLDKETSGCLVVAKDDFTHVRLADQFAGRSVRKIYHAIVCGELPADTGEIEAAIARHPSHRKRMAVSTGRGKPAYTTYRLLERLHGATLVEVHLHTGRTHQVRVHFQHIGFPLVGDITYGSRQNTRLTEATGCIAPRQMLHAQLLEFRHPRSSIRVAFQAPWPADFERTVSALRK